MTFTEWLHLGKQQQRYDPIGDIARDATQDPTWPRSATTLSEYKLYLRSVGACAAAMNALKRAWVAYKSASSC